MLSWGVTRLQAAVDGRQMSAARQEVEQLRCRENPKGRSARLFTDVVTQFVIVAGEPPDSQERSPSAEEVSYHISSHPLLPGAAELMTMLSQPCRSPPFTPAHCTHSDLRRVSDQGPVVSLSSGHLCTGLPQGGHVQDGHLGWALQHSS